ncbi:MAG: hypothetical protein ACTHMU_12605, partial [Thermomicrobiales bacterium]
DQPVAFHGEMEVLQVAAPGKGTYRIETFALLTARPAPSDFAPHIDRLTARLVARDGDSVTAEVHCTTSQVAICEAVARHADAGEAAPLSAHEDRPGRLHVMSLSGLAPDRQYTVYVTATEQAGATATARLPLFTGATQQDSGAASVTVPVELLAPSDAPTLAGLPLTFGVPLPKGQLYAVDACQVRAGEVERPAQARVHARWPDGSARWVLIDTDCPSGLQPAITLPAQVTLTPAGAPISEEEPQALTWDIGAAGISVTTQTLRVTVRRDQAGPAPQVERRGMDGAWRAVLTVDEASAPTIVLGDGRELRADAVTDLVLEEAGGARAAIRYQVPHQDSAGVTHLLSTVRVQVYARQPFMTLSHRLTVVSPELPPAAGGQAPGGFKQGTALTAGANEELRTLLAVRSATLRLSCAGNRQVGFAGQTYPLRETTLWRLDQEDDRAYRIEANGDVTEHAGRAAGWIAVEGAAGQLAVGIRHFWETYPNDISVSPAGIDVELLPALASALPPDDEDTWHRLDFWRDGDCYQLKAGLALRRDLLLAFLDAKDEATSAAIQAWFTQPPLVRPALDWLNATGALSPLAPKAGSPAPRYEALVDAAYADWLADREHTRAYGFLNFGDWYGESLWSWGNNEYDAAFTHYSEFLRGGAPGWAALAGQAAQHLTDVDTCNSSANPAQVGGQYMHMPGHAGGYLPPYFRSKIGGSKMLHSHMWVEGPVLHYLLTGDEYTHETVLHTAAWLIQGTGPVGLDHYDFTNLRECGWHLIHLSAIARLTADPRYTNAARLIIERVLERQGVNGGWDHLLTLSHCACPPPRHRGEAGFMAGILLAGLRRWHELTGDARIAEAIVRGAHWLIASTYDVASGHFRYTSCPKKRTPGFEYMIPLLEGLAYAYALQADEQLGAILTRGFAALGAQRENLGHSGFGKALCWQTRFVPIALACWQRGQRAAASQHVRGLPARWSRRGTCSRRYRAW